jgi:hypothetical protein
MNAWFGIEFNRKNTWFEQSKGWIDYLRRCMFMLQQGEPVVDAAYFIGEDAPKMTGIRQPALPEGYNFDYINAEVILNRLRVENGRLVLPEGLSYQVLVLPPQTTMRPLVLRKLRELVAAGAMVVGPPPHRSPSGQGYPMADDTVATLAAELWGQANGGEGNRYGQGFVTGTKDLGAVLKQRQAEPDVSLPGNEPVGWVHRKDGQADIYFITNQSDQQITLAPSFRVQGKRPEWWDAVTGEIRSLPDFRPAAGRTTVPLQLEPAQSAFIVFREPVTSVPVASGGNFPATTPVVQLAGPWQVTFSPGSGQPGWTTTRDTLTDWSAHRDPRIAFFAGQATYRLDFQVDKRSAGRKLWLDLGKVHAMAGVKLNGVVLGTAWTAPWHVPITGAAKAGRNVLEIQVANLWVNRLIGESRQPKSQRATWAPYGTYHPTDPPAPSGLLRPVTIRAEAGTP